MKDGYKYYIYSTLAICVQSILICLIKNHSNLIYLYLLNALFLCFWAVSLKSVYFKVKVYNDSVVGTNLISIKFLDTYYFFLDFDDTCSFIGSANSDIKEFHFSSGNITNRIILYFNDKTNTRRYYKYQNGKWEKIYIEQFIG